MSFESTLRKTFPSRLKEVREARRLNQWELGHLTYIPNSSICKFESGARVPSMISLGRLAVALGVSMDYLTGLDSKPPESYLSTVGLSHRNIGLLEDLAIALREVK